MGQLTETDFSIFIKESLSFCDTKINIIFIIKKYFCIYFLSCQITNCNLGS